MSKLSNSNSSSSSCGFEVIERVLEKEYAVSGQNGLKFNQVIFDGIFDVYPKDCIVFSTLTFRNNFIQSEGDKILLMQVGWSSLSEAILVCEQGLKNTISIDCQALRGDTTDVLYQLCYVTENNEVVGMSTPWSLREVQEPDLIEVHKEMDNPMTSKSRFSVLMGMYQDFYLAHAKLIEKPEKPCSVFQKLMEKAQAEQANNEVSIDDENYVEPKWVKAKKIEVENDLRKLRSMVNSLSTEVSETKEQMISETKGLMECDDEEPEVVFKTEEMINRFQNIDGSTFGKVDGDPDVRSFCVVLRRPKNAVKTFKDTLLRIECIYDKMMQPTSGINLIVEKINGLETHRKVLLRSILKHLFPPGEQIVFTYEELTDIAHELIEDENLLFDKCKSEEAYLRGLKYLQDRLEKYVGLETEAFRRVLMCQRKVMNFLISDYDPTQQLVLEIDQVALNKNDGENQNNIMKEVKQTREDLKEIRKMQPKAGIESMGAMLASMYKSMEETKMRLSGLDELCKNLSSSPEERTNGTGGSTKKNPSRKSVSEISSENSFSSDSSLKESERKLWTAFSEPEGRASMSGDVTRTKFVVTRTKKTIPSFGVQSDTKVHGKKFEKPKPQPRNLTKKMDEGPISAYFKKPMKKKPQLKEDGDETCMKCEDLRMKCEEMKKRLEDGATAYIDLRIQYEQLKKSGTEVVEDIA